MKIFSVVGIVAFVLFGIAAVTVSYFGRKYGVFDEEWHNANLCDADVPIRISFEKFTRLYAISPEKWATGFDRLLYCDDDSSVMQSVLLATYQDFRRYREWYEGKKKQEWIAEKKRVQNRFDDIWNKELNDGGVSI